MSGHHGHVLTPSGAQPHYVLTMMCSGAVPHYYIHDMYADPDLVLNDLLSCYMCTMMLTA